MCGRLACVLSPQDMCKACCYKQSGSNHFSVPQWKHVYNSGKTYKPSYNICPTEISLVLISGVHFKQNSRLLLPMVFGLVPHRIDAKYKTFNCRVETLENSRLFGSLLKKGNRCVVVCTGFYEWEKNGGKPYFIHGEQPDEVVIDDPKTWKLKFTPESGFLGFQPLKLAGLFDIQSAGTLEEATLSFTIITKEASSQKSWVHERLPVVLENNDSLDAWLNHEETDPIHILKRLAYQFNFVYFPVSRLVNKSSNKDISCIRFESHSESSTSNIKNSQDFFKRWLERGKKRKISGSLEILMKKSK